MIVPVDFEGYWRRVPAPGALALRGTATAHRRSPPPQGAGVASSYLTVSLAEPILDCALPEASVAYT